MADQIHETTKAPVTAASSGWPPPMSEALIQRQREYRDWLMDTHFRYACEICGNKRCPHHTDHRLACSGSNAVGQPGSAYQ
jgi:hypothetical protein